MNTNERFLRTVSAFLSLCSIRLSDDVASALKTLAENETDETAKTMYRCITDDLALADRLHRPICQDTGMLQFFLDVGTGSGCIAITLKKKLHPINLVYYLYQIHIKI